MSEEKRKKSRSIVSTIEPRLDIEDTTQRRAGSKCENLQKAEGAQLSKREKTRHLKKEGGTIIRPSDSDRIFRNELKTRTGRSREEPGGIIRKGERNRISRS